MPPASVAHRTRLSWFIGPNLYRAMSAAIPDKVQAFTGLPKSFGFYGRNKQGRVASDHFFMGGGQGASSKAGWQVRAAVPDERGEYAGRTGGKPHASAGAGKGAGRRYRRAGPPARRARAAHAGAAADVVRRTDQRRAVPRRRRPASAGPVRRPAGCVGRWRGEGPGRCDAARRRQLARWSRCSTRAPRSTATSPAARASATRGTGRSRRSQADLDDDYITQDGAARDYGVALGADGRIDPVATARRRAGRTSGADRDMAATTGGST